MTATGQQSNFVALKEAADKALRHRKFHWYRHENGFCDKPIWREIAVKLALPLPTVVAFALRLEELGNDAHNLGHVRGYVGHFRPTEFAAALDIVPDDAARIFAAMEHPDLGWVAFDSVATFYDRNPDRIDESATERKRRQRRRDDGMKRLARAYAAGQINETERRAAEAELLLDERVAKRLSTVTPSQRDARAVPEVVIHGHDGHNVTPRDIVTVTPDQTKNLSTPAVDNSGDGARVETEGLPNEQGPPDEQSSTEAARWLETEGVRLIVELSNEPPVRAAMLVERWGRDLQDEPLMVRIIAEAVDAGLTGARLQLVIGEQVKRHLDHKICGTPLPLMPPRPKQQRLESAPVITAVDDTLNKRRASGE